MNINPSKRLDFNGIMNHSWVKNNNSKRSTKHLTRAITQLKKFNARRKFKAGVFMAIGIKKMTRK
tara:strand:+ start:1348 stop:1542 length:195 start_codon:yes stop_codon:yes gene_type:complete